MTYPVSMAFAPRAATEYRITRLFREDAHRYNDFLRAACVQHPDTLRFAPADVDAAPFSVPSADEGCTLLALSPSGDWLGVGSVERERGREKRRHIAWVLRMYVATPGLGIGRALLRELKREGLQLEGVNKLNLTVAAHNAAAIELYRSEGFREFSREEDAFRSGGRGITELTMSLDRSVAAL